MRRYNRDQRIAGGKLQTAQAVKFLRRAQRFNLIHTYDIVIHESQRLDHLANKYLGNSKDWWILSALSDIGWGLQVPPGTVIKIPVDLDAILAMVN